MGYNGWDSLHHMDDDPKHTRLVSQDGSIELRVEHNADEIVYITTDSARDADYRVTITRLNRNTGMLSAGTASTQREAGQRSLRSRDN